MASSFSNAKSLLVLLFLLVVFTLTAESCSAPPSSPCTTPVTPVPVAPVAKCPRNALKLAACADVLGGLVHVVLGDPPSGSKKCCALLKGLADVEAAACLCTAIKANVLGINLEVPVALSVLLSSCQKTVPPGFTCP